ncbi:MAG TPA: T9SS type A sorting domain-containing protein [Candidatus Kapabacteria bacterium]|nr:T9SS type A sorting domain-containing protein [Candidatus Kapabacteria bacterium]
MLNAFGLLPILLFFTFSSIHGQTFQKKFTSGYPRSFAVAAIEAETGSYMVIGEREYDSLYSTGSLLIKLDKFGLLLGSQLITRLDKSDSFEPRCMIRTFDEGYAITGVISGDTSKDFCILKINRDNKIEWNNVIGTPELPDEPRSIIQTSDSGFIIAGYATPVFDLDPGILGLVVKLDKTGSMVWSYSISGFRTDFLAITETSDSGIVFCGSMLDSSNTTSSTITKLDKNGILSWRKVIGIPSRNDEAFDITSTVDGGFAVCGVVENSTDNCYISKCDAEGKVLWSKIIDAFGQEMPVSIVERKDSSLVLAGRMSFKSPWGGTDSLFVASLTASGELKYFRMSTQQYSLSANSITKTLDNGFIVTGFAENKYSGASIFVSKFDSNGSNCNMRDLLVSTNQGIREIAMGFPVSSGSIYQSKAFFAIEPITISESDLCDQTYVAHSQSQIPNVSLFPNPVASTQTLTVVIPSNLASGRYLLSIHDALGKEVYHEKKNLSGAEESITIQIETLPAGIYTVELLDANTFTAVYHGKIVKL